VGDTVAVGDTMARIAAAVRDRRRALELTQQDVADLAGVSERFVRFVEQGKPSVRVDSLAALLDALGLALNAVPSQTTSQKTSQKGAR
jgi:y4mF family transcriptional regulator